ncbi:MAG: GDP-L-fucose synthase family protein [Burkholderiaceae bacterium]|jgi:GDP-L-fucose synthase
MMPDQKVYIAGHRGMVGRAIERQLRQRGLTNVLTCTHADLDLTRQADVEVFFAAQRPAVVILAAARVGGIHANNTYPADFIRDNLLIQANVIDAAHRYGVQRLLFLGSSCIYPRQAEQPMREEALLTGVLEPTNEPYAIAKIAGIKLCESYNRQYGRDYRSVMPTNLYGPFDNFHPDNSHVIPAMMRRFHEAAQHGAAQVTVWGTGRPMREFLHVDDMAQACLHVLQLDSTAYAAHTRPMLSHINVGTGRDCTIAELARTMASVVGYRGDIVFDTDKPDGAPRKLLDVSRLSSLGWRAQIALEAGLQGTYAWFLANACDIRGGASV